MGVPVYDAPRKCPFCKASVVDIYGDHAIACHGRGDAIAKHDHIGDKTLSAWSSENLSQAWKVGKHAAFDVSATPPLQSNSLNKAATNQYAFDAADEKRYCLHNKNRVKWESIFVPISMKSLAEYRQLSKNTQAFDCNVTIVLSKSRGHL